MGASKRTPYVRYILKTEYENEPTIEQIIDDIQKYNAQIVTNNYNIQFSFDEFCQNIDRRIDLSYIDPNEISGNHFHDFYELIYVFKGTILQYINDKSFSMETGSFLFLHPSVIHSFYSYKDTRAINILVKKEYFERFLSNLNIRIRNSFINRVVEEKFFALFAPRDDNDVLRPLMNSLCEISEMEPLAKKLIGINDLGGNTPVDILLTEQIFQQIILMLIKSVDNGSLTKKILSNNRVSVNTTEVIAYIRENYKDITIDELSKKFGYSTAQIYRIIKKSTGNNFNTIIMTMRIQRAKYLLRNTDFSISHIAHMVGIGSSEYFARLFKRQCGYTPTEYKKLHKKGIYIPSYSTPPNGDK